MSALATLIPFDTVPLVAGIIALYPGVEALVEDAFRLATGFGLRTAIIGVTIVVLVTATPELFVAALSGLDYSPDPELGAIVGPNTASIGLVLRVSVLIESMGVSTAILRRYVPLTIVAVVMLVVFGIDGNLSTVDGGVLLFILVAFMGYLLYQTRSVTVDAVGVDEISIEDEDEVSAQFKDMIYLVLGLLLLSAGPNWLAQGGQGLFESFRFGPRFVGLTAPVLGTPLPELAASVIGTVRGESEPNIGNVAGSNIYNVVAVLGILTITVPVNVPPSTISLGFPALLVFAFGVIMLMLCNRDVSRLDGGILIVGYLALFWFIFP